MRHALFSKRPRGLLGLAIDCATVKVLALSQAAGHYQLEAAGCAPIAANVLINHDIKEPQALADAIALAYQRADSPIKHVAMALHSTLTISKHLPLDIDANVSLKCRDPSIMTSSHTEAELFAHVALEASKWISHPLTDMALDYEIVNKSDLSPSVLVVCSRQAHVDALVKVVRMAGLIPHILDVETLARERAARFMTSALPATSIIALIDIAPDTVTMLVLQDKTVLFTHEETLHIPLLVEHARGMGLNQTTNIVASHSLATQLYEQLPAVINRSCQFFYAAQQQDIHQVLLAGIGATVESIAAFIQDKIGIPTTLATPLAQVTVSPRLTVYPSPQEAATLMLTLGLALRHFDHVAD